MPELIARRLNPKFAIGACIILGVWFCVALMLQFPQYLTTPYFYSADANRAFTQFYIGMDWFLADLVVSSMVFLVLERTMPIHNPIIAREGWKTDLQYFAANHLLVGVVLWPASVLAEALCAWHSLVDLRTFSRELSFPIALIAVFLLADLCQYWTHRAYHRIPWLWRLHAIHHSSTQLDWLSGSRQHILELCITRSFLLLPLVVVGFAPEVVLSFVVIGGLQAVFNHANVRLNLDWLEPVIVTPRFHRWHHASSPVAKNRNFAAHVAFLDYLFGTAAPVERGSWPTAYGLAVPSHRTKDSGSKPISPAANRRS